MGKMKEESEKPNFEVEGKPIETVEDVFKFIFAQEEAKAKIAAEKARIVQQRADVIKASFVAVAGQSGSVAAAKFAYQRWMMSEAERQKYDGTLFEVTKELGGLNDMMESNRIIIMEKMRNDMDEVDKMLERISGLGSSKEVDEGKPEDGESQ